MNLLTQNFIHIITKAHRLRFMDKLKDEVVTDQSLSHRRQDTIYAVISIIVLLLLVATFYIFR